MARPSGRDIRSEALQHARDAIQSKGINGFSFGSVADRVGVRTASIHHHFKRKSDLIGDTTAMYREEFRSLVNEIDADTAVERLDAYFDLFLAPAHAELMCLCGAVAAAWDDAGDFGQAEVSQFFGDEIAWVAKQLQLGIESGDFRASIDPDSVASALVAALEGQFLLVRAGKKDAAKINSAKTILALAT